MYIKVKYMTNMTIMARHSIFLLRSGLRQGSIFSLLFNFALQVLGSAIRQKKKKKKKKKERKRMQIGKEEIRLPLFETI